MQPALTTPSALAAPPHEADAGPLRFVNVAETAGIHYQWTIPGKRPLNILQTIGNGCALLDVNGDGNLDVLLIGPHLALYLGDGKGHFTEATASYGLDTLKGDFLGCAVGDYDNDGCPDVYVTAYQGGVLLHNEAGKTFRDVTRQAGIAPQAWGTSASFVDVDGDGKLDLYICNYVQFDPKTSPLLCTQSTSRGGAQTACGPERYAPLGGVLYRNLDGRRFVDVTQVWGAAAQSGKGLGVAAANYDGSGRQSLALANDETPGDLLQNRTKNGAKPFQNVGVAAGIAFGPDDRIHGGMGVDWGDYDNDGRLDLLVMTFYSEAKCLYHNDGDGQFHFPPQQAGLVSRPLNMATAFGCRFFDADNDGWLDFAVASGHVQDNVADFAYYDHSTYRQPTLVLHNCGDQTGANGKSGVVHFEDVSEHAGADLQKPIVGRGLATGDFDNDGRVDLLVVDSEGSPLLLHNASQPASSWVGFRLIGTGSSNRDAYGAMVTLTVGGRKLVRHCHADGSYLSSSDPRVHFGLGNATKIERVTIHWPDGKTQTWGKIPVNHYSTITEGKDEAR